MKQSFGNGEEGLRISFIVPGVPVAQPRQRHRTYRVGGRTIVGNYVASDSPIHTWKSLIRIEAAKAYSGPPLDGFIRLKVTCVWPRTKALLAKRAPDGRIPKSTKPDFDNVVKAVCDALNGWWADDARVCEATIYKHYASRDESPHAEIEVQQFNPSF